MAGKLMLCSTAGMRNIFGFILLFTFWNSFSQSVDPLTGRAVINIPIGGVSALDLGISLSLSHHGGALRVTEGPGNAGMGWNVNMGGYISREVRGLPDEYNDGTRKGWRLNSNASAIQNFTPSDDNNLSTCSDETTDWNFIYGLGYTKDTEPDIYYFSAPGLSGKFIYGADGNPKIIPYQDIQISKSTGGYTIKTNNGMVYTFGDSISVTRKAFKPASNPTINFLQSAFNYYSTPVSYVTSWNLTSIQSTATQAQATFTYTKGEQAIGFQAVTSISGNTTTVDTVYFLRDSLTQKMLTAINLKNYSINIAWGNSVIDKITISESETGESKEFDFIYKGITSSTDNKYPLISKPFLVRVRQQNGTVCSAMPAYLFMYNNIDTTNNNASIPWRTGWGQDVFGYYNGSTGNKNVPKVYFYAGETGGKRFRVTPNSGATLTSTFSSVSGQTMDVSKTNAVFGSLKSITYPTGGIVTINYEINKYRDSSTGQTLYGPGVRVASITSFGGELAYGKTSSSSSVYAETKTYTYVTDTTSSGRLLYPPVFALTDGTNFYRSQTDLGPGSQIYYSHVRETVSGRGYKEYSYDLSGVYEDTGATPSKVLRYNGAPCTVGYLLNGQGPYAWPFAPVTDVSYKQGLLTDVSEYKESGELVSERVLTYFEPSTSGSTIKGLRFEEISDGTGSIYHYSLYQINVNKAKILKQELIKQASDTLYSNTFDVNTVYQYNSKLMPVRVVKTNPDNSKVVSTISYAQDYAYTNPLSTDLPANAIKKLNSVNRYGEAIESIQKFITINGDSSITGSQVNTFKDYGTNSCVWPYESRHHPASSSITPSAIGSSGGYQTFSFDSGYILDATLSYANGLPVNQAPHSLVPSGIHYWTGTGIPIASFTNCNAENAVYEGFEFVGDHGLSVSGSGTTTPIGWTGKKCIQFGTSNSLTSGNVTKAGNSYRISMWVNASSSATITVQAKNGSTVQATSTLNYSNTGQWTYLEALMDVTSVSSTFTFAVSTSATVTLDDFVARPKTAIVQSKTIMPLTGITSQSDDHGNSAVIAYDALGRKVNTFDRQRNLTELTEYGNQVSSTVELSPNFNTNKTQIIVGQSVNFSSVSEPGCASGITYSWTFKDYNNSTTTASGASVNHVFSLYGAHSVTLSVSASGFTTKSYTENICVTLPNTIALSIDSNNGNTYYYCTGTGQVKTFTASFTNLGSLSPTLSWYIRVGAGDWQTASSAGANPSSGTYITYTSPQSNYSVICVLTVGSYGSVASGDYSCNIQINGATSNQFDVTYHNDQPCH